MTRRSIAWWLVGLPYVFALMMAPAAFLGGIVALPFYLWGRNWQFAFALATFAGALLLAVYLTRLVTQHEKEID